MLLRERIYHGDTEDTELHGEKGVIAAVPFPIPSVKLCALRVSVVNLYLLKCGDARDLRAEDEQVNVVGAFIGDH